MRLQRQNEMLKTTVCFTWNVLRSAPEEPRTVRFSLLEICSGRYEPQRLSRLDAWLPTRSQALNRYAVDRTGSCYSCCSQRRARPSPEGAWVLSTTRTRYGFLPRLSNEKCPPNFHWTGTSPHGLLSFYIVWLADYRVLKVSSEAESLIPQVAQPPGEVPDDAGMKAFPVSPSTATEWALLPLGS